MARRLVRISLATKLRLLFAVAVLGILTAALVVPWYFLELLAEQGVQRPGSELTRLRLNEWQGVHSKDKTAADDKTSRVVALYAPPDPEAGRTGPTVIVLKPDANAPPSLDSRARKARLAFSRNRDQELAIMEDEGERGETIYRAFRAVRIEPRCLECHRKHDRPKLRFQAGQLVGMIDMTLPGETAAGPLVWWTRGAFLVGAVLAGMLAFILFALISQRLILRPLRDLRDLADKVAEGDLTVRSAIETGDELQRLGESFNEMLQAITDQTDRLRDANRALDLKLNELAEANVMLFQANKVKSEFLANVSHELRTPLNSIIGFADLLIERDDERIRRYGQNISTAAKDLLRVINDLLDMAKIEAGKAEVRFDKVSVTDTCETLLALMKPLADKKQLDLHGELAADLPIVVTDGGRLQQILYNLLSNAVKFTPAGGRVTLTTAGENPLRNGENVDEVTVAVSDSGPGIAEADQPHIFEKFYQTDRALTKEAQGTGLGLAISRELTNLLGGRLSLKSTPGRGATFTLHLPVHPLAAEAADQADGAA